MKTLTILLLLISISCAGQNRFDKEFTKADSVFTQLSDSVKLSYSFREMTDTAKITMTVTQCLQLYFHAYLNGSYDTGQNNGDFDFYMFWKRIKDERKSINYTIGILKGKY
jgi:hypothetical protein